MANPRNDRRRTRRADADERAIARAARTDAEQAELLDQRPGESQRERERLAA